MNISWVVRPWGRYSVLYQDTEVAVKLLEVYPGQAMSLQHHEHRDERWTVTDGSPVVWIGDDVLTAYPGSVYDVPAGTLHRIGNATSAVVKIVEVLVGNYDEDDIVRHDDYYGRV